MRNARKPAPPRSVTQARHAERAHHAGRFSLMKSSVFAKRGIPRHKDPRPARAERGNLSFRMGAGVSRLSARVARDAGAAMEHLDGRLCSPHLDDLADHARWHRVEVARDFDVIIRRNARTTPLGVLVGRGRPSRLRQNARSQCGQFRARSISFATRPRRPDGPPDHERAGETFSPSPLSDSQTSAGKPTIALGSV
jgi:hypothetical protein